MREGGVWNTDPVLMQIREEAANFMAKFANTSALDVNADVYSDEEEDTPSGSDAEESEDSDARYEDSYDADDGNSGGADGRVPYGVRFSASGEAIFDPDMSSSDASSDFDQDEFDE